MSGRGNPFVVEGMRGYFSEGRILRSSLLAAGAPGIVLAVMWPRSTIVESLRLATASDTFTAVAACFLLVLLFLGARYGAEDFSADAAGHLRDYVTFTPVSVPAVVAGRLVFSTLHTLVLLLLGAPFLAAAMAVGGAGFPQAFAALAVAGSASLAARMAGLLALAVISRRRQLRSLVVIPSVAAALVASWLVAPWANPIPVMVSILQSPGGAAAGLRCAAADSAAALLLACCVAAVLAMVRVRARRGGHGA